MFVEELQYNDIFSKMWFHKWQHDLFYMFKNNIYIFRGSCKDGGITSCIKLLRIMLETWYVSTRTYVVYVVSEDIHFSNKALLSFFAEIAFFETNSTFTHNNSVRAVLKTFSSVFKVCKIKGHYYWKYKFWWLCVRNLDSGLR